MTKHTFRCTGMAARRLLDGCLTIARQVLIGISGVVVDIRAQLAGYSRSNMVHGIKSKVKLGMFALSLTHWTILFNFNMFFSKLCDRRGEVKGRIHERMFYSMSEENNLQKPAD